MIDLRDTNIDTLDNGTDGELDQVIGSDCGGNSYRDKGRLQRKWTSYKFPVLYSSIPYKQRS